jgi:hypothetical protein
MPGRPDACARWPARAERTVPRRGPARPAGCRRTKGIRAGSHEPSTPAHRAGYRHVCDRHGRLRDRRRAASSGPEPGVSTSSAGLLVTAFAIAYAIGGPVLAVGTARLSRRPLLVSALALLIAANILAAVAPSYVVMLMARVFAALGGLVLPAGTALVPPSPPGSQPAPSSASRCSITSPQRPPPASAIGGQTSKTNGQPLASGIQH